MAVTVTRTLPDHERCDRHKHYRLNCAQYEELLARSGQCCEICGQAGKWNTGGKLFIDHDVTPWGVRGLLCVGCNSQLSRDNEDWPAAAGYLANSWWRQQCVALGYPAQGLPPEPPIASAVRNQWKTIFVRIGERWDAPSQNSHHPPAGTWKSLCHSYGPHNLVPYNLRKAFEDDSLPFEIRYPVLNAIDWGAVRRDLGLPEPAPKERRPAFQPRDTMPWLKSPERAARGLRSLFTPDECLRIAELLAADPGEASDGQAAS